MDITPQTESTEADSQPSGFRVPEWLRPPLKRDHALSSLQFLPLYYLAAILFFLVLGTAVEYALPASTPRLAASLLSKILLAIAFIVPSIAVARIEGRPFGAYGLPLQQAFGKLFWMGVLWGAISLSLLLFVLRAAGVFAFGSLGLSGTRALQFAVFWAAFFLFVALFEEFAFRGYVLFALQQVAGFWPTALLLSAIFAYMHRSNPGESWLGTLGAGAVGLFFCFTIRRTGNLWFAVGMHAAWDWAQSFLYGVPDSGVVEPGHLLNASLHGQAWLSGGSVGPEGSVLVFVLIGGMWIVFDRTFPRNEISSARQED